MHSRFLLYSLCFLLLAPAAMGRVLNTGRDNHFLVVPEYRPPETLAEAVVDGTPDQVLSFLKNGGDANGRLPQSDLPFLHFTFQRGDLEKAGYLFVHNADPYAKDKSGTTVFDMALSDSTGTVMAFLFKHSDSRKWQARYQNTDYPAMHGLALGNERVLVKTLLLNGWNLNQPDRNGDSPLIRAIQQNNTEAIQFLLALKADMYHQNNVGYDALYFAINNKRTAALDMLLRNGINTERRYENDMTALMFAVKKQNRKAVEWLIRAGSNVHSVNRDGVTALALSLKKRYFRKDIFKTLLDKGASVSSQNKHGQSVLSQAVYDRCYSCVDLLLKNGANVNDGGKHRQPGMDAYSWPPLFWAVEKQDIYLVRKLLKAGANINFVHPKDQTTVLFKAIRDTSADAEILRLLIKHDANVKVVNRSHWPLLLHANAFEGVQAVKVLIEAGADVNKPNWHGWTPLMAAAQIGGSEKTKLLLKHGAKVNARTRKGWTALSEAKRAGHFDVVRLLEKAGGVDPINVQPKTRKDRGNLKIEIKVLD